MMMASPKKLVSRLGPALAVMVIIYVLSSIPKGTLIPDFGLRDFEIKKSAHILAYGVLANTYLWAITGWRNVRRTHLVVAIMLATLYGVSDEGHQRFVPGRVGTIMDVGIDALGATLAITAWYWIRYIASKDPYTT